MAIIYFPEYIALCCAVIPTPHREISPSLIFIFGINLTLIQFQMADQYQPEQSEQECISSQFPEEH